MDSNFFHPFGEILAQIKSRSFLGIKTKMMKHLLFVHIPKTGGISLHVQLQKAFLPSKSIRFGDALAIEKFVSMNQEDLKKFEYITGHIPLRNFRNKGLDYPALIIFRDPIKRIISYYKYLNQSQLKDHKNYKFSNFDEFLDWGLSKNFSMRNFQCRFLMGNRDGVKFIDEPIKAKAAIECLRNDSIYPVILELHYDDLLLTLTKLLNVKLKNVKNNVSFSQEIELTEHQLKLLEPLVEEDRKLLEAVKKEYTNHKEKFLQYVLS